MPAIVDCSPCRARVSLSPAGWSWDPGSVAGLLLLPGDQMLACGRDLAPLPFLGRVLLLVITRQQQDDSASMEVNEYPQQDRDPRPRHRVRWLASEHVRDFIGRVADPELMQALPKRLEPLRVCQSNAPHSQNMPQGSV